MSSDAENNYQQAHALSLSDPEAFWGLAAEDLHWVKRWDKVLDTSQTPHGQWFVGGELNTCYNALDRHVENGRGDYLALIYDSPVAGNKVARFTYSELKDLTARFAGVLKSNGVDLDAIELIGGLSAVDAIDRFRNGRADYLHILHPFAQALMGLKKE